MGEGDLITYLNVWRGWEESGRSGQWAARNAVNHRTMLRAADIRSQLLRHLKWEPNLCILTGIFFGQFYVEFPRFYTKFLAPLDVFLARNMI